MSDNVLSTALDMFVLRVPVEIVVKVVDDVDVATPLVGQRGAFDDELFDANGALLGTSSGTFTIRYVRPGDDALMTYYREEITLTDGVVRAEGWADFNDVRHGRWVFYP